MGWFSSLVGGVVGFLVGGPVGAVIGAGIGATKVGEKVVNTVIEFVTQPFMPNIPSYDAGQEAERQQGVLVQSQGSTVNVPVVYGYRQVAGSVVFAETGSTNNKYLYVAYVFSEGLVEGLREVFIDDYQIPASLIPNLNAGQLVNITTEKYANRVQMRWSPGVYYANPRSNPLGGLVKGDVFAEAPSFRSDMVYNGLATLFVRYEWKEIKTQADADSNPFSGSIPEIKISLLGRRIASLLVDSTETTVYDSNIVRYSTNPAEILLDYLRNPRYGKGLQNEDIDWTSWKQAARKCNQTVTYVASGIQGPILTLNAVIPTNTTIMNNVKSMLQNFRAYMPYVQGKYKLRIEDAGNNFDILSGAANIVQTFTKDDIVSDITYVGIDKSAKYTHYVVTYVDPDQKWSNQQVVFPETEAERQVFINRDGGRENQGETTLGGITNYAIAKDMARLLFNKSRRQESCMFTATSKALELEPGDCIRISANILNFGTDPWRVISIKINNDMTVDLGCVRNPDDIYPYVRVGEEDIVDPPYIPKGSIIYYPSSQNLPPVGLVPPTNAIFPSTVITPTTPTNPIPTDPNGSTGGGVGGGTPNGGTAGPIITDPTTPPTISVPPTNNPPTAPPPPPPFSAVLALKSSRAVLQSGGGYIYYLTFTQPQDGLYNRSTLWWRPNAQSPWTSSEILDRPGAGGDINWSLGPLPAGAYNFIVRSYSTTGEASNQQLQGVISVAPNASELNPSLTGIATASAVSLTLGWTLDTSIAPVARYDDEIEVFKISPKLVGGAIQNPRRMTVEIAQIASTYGKIFNYGIQGVRIYYKYSTDTYWFYEDFNFENIGNPYYPGKNLKFDLAGDFGAAGATSAQTYTFAAKLLYKDGGNAQKYLPPVNAQVESFIGKNQFTSYGLDPYASAPVQNTLIPSTWNPQTIDPATAYTLGSDIKPTINKIANSPTTSVINWFFDPPVSQRNKWRGYKIRFREVVPGTKTDFITVDTGFAVDLATNQVLYTLQNAGYSHNKTYEWAITAQYSNNGVTTDCDTTLYAKGVNIPFEFRLYSNLYDYFNFVEIDTKIALGNLVTTFPAVPVIAAQSWTKIQYRSAPPGATGQISPISPYSKATAADIYRASSSLYYVNRWYRLRFSAPAGYNQVVVYRRVYDATGAQRTTTATTSKYYGLGAWEKAVIPMPTADANGFRTINLRGPIDPFLFNSSTSANTTTTLYQEFFGPTGKYPSGGFINNVYPYFGTGNTYNSGTITNYVEFLIVLANTGVESTKALRLRDFYAAESGAEFKTEVEGFGAANVVNNEIVNVSDYNNFDAGFKRNINEALTSIATAALFAGTNPIYPPNRAGIPNSTNSGTSYTVFLQGLTETGIQVY